jgi:ABC transporter transmembrane region
LGLKRIAPRENVNKGQTGFYPGSSVARSSLSREFVNYFERDVPATVNSLFALFGALVLLFFSDVWSAACCLVGSRIQESEFRIQESEKHTSRLLRSSSSSCSIRDHWGLKRIAPRET